MSTSRDLSLAVVQMAANPGTRDEAIGSAIKAIEACSNSSQTDLVLLPEFFNTPYFPQYSNINDHWDLAETIDGPTISAIRETAARLQVSVIASIYEETHPGMHFDSSIVIDNSGLIVGRYRKTHAPAIAGGYEKLYYTPGSGFPVFDIHGWRIGIQICYDWRFPEVTRILAAKGAELVVMPFATPRMNMWEEAMATRAWENQIYVAACNKAGSNDAWDFAGESLVVSPNGELIAKADAQPDSMLLATLSKQAIRTERAANFNWRDRRPELYRELCVPADDEGEADRAN